MKKPLKFLFVMDPLAKLNHEWDSSLAMIRELAFRGHRVWIADIPDIIEAKRLIAARARELTVSAKARRAHRQESLHYHYTLSPSPARLPVTFFDLIMIRKDPPFNLAYFYLTHFLEKAAAVRPVFNHPVGIRHTNEKLSILHFPKWIPETRVTASAAEILNFQKKTGGPVVVKPLDSKGGEGVFLIRDGGKKSRREVMEASHKEKNFLMAQAFIPKAKGQSEKRILLLNGDILSAYEKRAPRGDFRANLSLDGATFHASGVSAKEKQLVRDLKPYLVRLGLVFTGIDVLSEKLLEINVTSPAGLYESRLLYPELRCAERVADFLESRARD